jgi:hypothetical protein
MKALQIIVAFASSLGLLSPSIAQSDIAVAPNESVAQVSQADWSKAWWQWAGSFDRADSPVADRTGTKCHLKQSGPVWFLAGTYGSHRVIRSCTVPRGKYLFFPLINYVVMPKASTAACASCCASNARSAKSLTDRASNLILDLDGRRIEGLAAYRQVPTECFDIGARAEPRYRVFPSAANGYYIMLRPLSPGRHVLNFGGMLRAMSQAVTYTLLVQ